MLADIVGQYDVRNQYKNFFYLFKLLFGKIEGFLFFSPLWLLIVFTFISIVRRKASAWEFGIITLIWGMVIYVFPHLQT